MATTNTLHLSASSVPSSAYKRVPQQGRHDDTFAVIASIASKTLQEVFQQAEAFGLPKTGPYHAWIDGDLIAKLLAHYGWVATIWKESASVKDLPDLAMVMVDYHAEYEIGRNVLVYRSKSAEGKTTLSMIDPYPHTDTKLHIRSGDLAELKSNWFIGITAMNKSTQPTGK